MLIWAVAVHIVLILGLFADFCYCEHCCCEYSCMNFSRLLLGHGHVLFGMVVSLANFE